MTKQVALLRRMLRTERSNTAHHTLQHKLLAAELHEAQQTLAAFTHIRHETDRLLFELTIPINTCTTCRRHYQKIQRRLRKILQEWKHDIPTKTLRTQNESQNTLTALNASLNTTDTEAHAINTHKSLSTCHGLMSPISFHPTRRKRRRNVKNDPDTLPNTLKRHLTHHYALRSYQSLPISPNTSPLLRS